MTLDTSIEFLKGIGTERAKLIANVLDVRTVEDFLHFFPIRYLDKSKVYKVADVKEDNVEIQLKGRITELQEVTYAKGKKRLSGKFYRRNRNSRFSLVSIHKMDARTNSD